MKVYVSFCFIIKFHEKYLMLLLPVKKLIEKSLFQKFYSYSERRDIYQSKGTFHISLRQLGDKIAYDGAFFPVRRL